MISRALFLQAIEGSLMLLQGREEGMERFELSVDGFWRSFYALLIIAPCFALVSLLRYNPAMDPGGWPFFASNAISFAIAVASFPLLALILCRFFNLGGNYVPLIVAINWTSTLQAGIFVMALLLALALPSALASMVMLVTFVGVLYFQWFVTRTALQTSGSIAFGFLMLDILINEIIHTRIESLFTPS